LGVADASDVNRPGVSLGVLLWCWVLILFHWLEEAFGGRLEFLGTMNDRVPATGQWWRLFTAITLHAMWGISLPTWPRVWS